MNNEVEYEIVVILNFMYLTHRNYQSIQFYSN